MRTYRHGPGSLWVGGGDGQTCPGFFVQPLFRDEWPDGMPDTHFEMSVRHRDLQVTLQVSAAHGRDLAEAILRQVDALKAAKEAP